MILLALDTSTDRAAVALDVGTGPIRVAPIDPDRRHGRGLIPAIAGLLRAEGLTVRDLDAVAVGLGPGSYTGLRIGLTAAKTLAYAADRPLIGLDSLEAIARNAPDDATSISVIVDAQRGDAYLADFARDRPGEFPRRLGPTRIEPVEPWAKALDGRTLVLGPAMGRWRVDWPESARLGTVDQGHPSSVALIGLAREALAEGRFADPFALEPTYHRRSAAEDQWDHRASR